MNDELITCEVNGNKVEAKNVVVCTNSYTYEGTDGTNGLKMYGDAFCPVHVYQVSKGEKRNIIHPKLNAYTGCHRETLP